MKTVCSVIVPRESVNSLHHHRGLLEFLIKSVLYILYIGNYHLVKLLFIWEEKYHILARSYSPTFLNLNTDCLFLL